MYYLKIFKTDLFVKSFLIYYKNLKFYKAIMWSIYIKVLSLEQSKILSCDFKCCAATY